MDQQKPASSSTAAVLVIGDEILSGRTEEVNIRMIAGALGPLGIDLAEARVVPDRESAIVAALNQLRAAHDYVFTTGGIGPTHDDITADAVAAAFGVGIDYHAQALALLAERYGAGDFNDMRRRMARIPDGATLVKNPVSTAPGFRIGNVFVLAGVPRIARAMMEEIVPTLPQGIAVRSVTLSAPIAEGVVAPGLAAIQKANPDVSIGSYPFYGEAGLGVELVTRGRDGAAVERAAGDIEALLKGLGVPTRRVGG